MKLKTLKDLYTKSFYTDEEKKKNAGDLSIPDGQFVTSYDIVHVEDLRQSAIEWIKELEKQHITFYGNNICKPDCQACPKIGWIKHFFNIDDNEHKSI